MEDKIIGYHSTSIKKYRKIIINGFNPIKYADKSKYKNKKQSIRTWVTTVPEFMYGKVCIKVDLTGLNSIVNEDVIICKEEYIPPDRILGKINYNYLEEINEFDRDVVETLFKK